MSIEASRSALGGHAQGRGPSRVLENDVIHRLWVGLLKKQVALFHVKRGQRVCGLITCVSTGPSCVLRRVSRETRRPVDNFCG